MKSFGLFFILNHQNISIFKIDSKMTDPNFELWPLLVFMLLFVASLLLADYYCELYQTGNSNEDTGTAEDSNRAAVFIHGDEAVVVPLRDNRGPDEGRGIRERDSRRRYSRQLSGTIRR